MKLYAKIFIALFASIRKGGTLPDCIRALYLTLFFSTSSFWARNIKEAKRLSEPSASRTTRRLTLFYSRTYKTYSHIRQLFAVKACHPHFMQNRLRKIFRPHIYFIQKNFSNCNTLYIPYDKNIFEVICSTHTKSRFGGKVVKTERSQGGENHKNRAPHTKMHAN